METFHHRKHNNTDGSSSKENDSSDEMTKGINSCIIGREKVFYQNHINIR